MKNILLATTALVMSAGFASAEVTFSGTAEGGVTRTAKAAAVAAVAGRNFTTNNDATAAVGATASTTTDNIQWVGGKLVTIAGSGTNTAVGTAVTAAAVNAATVLVNAAQAAYDAQVIVLAGARKGTGPLATAGAATATQIINDINQETDDLIAAQKTLLTRQAELALLTGSAAVAAKPAGDVTAYSGYDFNIGLSAASDNGITFAAGFDMGAGSLSDIANNELDTQGTTIGAPAVSVSMNGFTVAFKQDGIDDLYDNDQNGDVSIAGTVGTVTFKIVHDLEEDVAAVAASTTYTAGSATAGAITTQDYVPASIVTKAASAAVYNTTSYTLGTTVGGVGLALTGTDKNDVGLSTMKAKATYSMDALTFGIESNNRGDSTKMLNATKVSLAYAGEGVSASVSSNDDKDWDASATLTAGANSATFATDEESAWEAQVASDLGGGASVFGYVDSTELFMAGVRFKF